MRNKSHSIGPTAEVFRKTFCDRVASVKTRRGAVVVLVAVMLVLLMIMLAFTVDVPYMQLVRTELHIATDAAAKAGAEALSRTQDPSQAIQTAISVAAQNAVAGQPLMLAQSDVVLGRCQKQTDGSCSFTAGLQPYNSVQVNSHLDSNSANGPAKLLFGSIVGVNSFQPRQQATAGQTSSEICLVLDRSHSMTWDLSGVAWQYPTAVRVPQYYQPPDSQNSRWAALTTAVQAFTTIVGSQKSPPRVALVTWASDMPSSTPPFPVVAIESGLTTDMTSIMTPITTRGSNVMWGSTNMAAGIDAGRGVLTSWNVKPLANKVMILMTDGQWNQGRDPILAAQDANNAGIQIHTICLLAGSSEAVCQQIADITGGTYTYAGNAAELQAAFEKLANQMMVTLIQ